MKKLDDDYDNLLTSKTKLQRENNELSGLIIDRRSQLDDLEEKLVDIELRDNLW